MVGCGGFARHHLEAWRRIPGIEIVAAADPHVERAFAFAERAYDSAATMLDREQLDFIDIVTRTDRHLPLVELAIERRVPVICQKPLAPNWADAVRMVQMAELARVPLMIHDNWRWHPWYRAAQRMIAEGAIGPVISYGFRSRANDGLGNEPYASQAYFRGLNRLIIDQNLVHHIDTARFLFGEIDMITAVAGRRNRQVAAEDWAILTLTHDRPIHGWIDGHRFRDPGSSGAVAGDATFEGENGTLSILPHGDVVCNQRLAWQNTVSEGYRGDSVRAAQAHFIACLETGTPFETSGTAYLPTFAAVQAAYRSLEEGRRVCIADEFPPTAKTHLRS